MIILGERGMAMDYLAKAGNRAQPKPGTYQEVGFGFGSWLSNFSDYWLLVRYLVLRFFFHSWLTRNLRP